MRFERVILGVICGVLITMAGVMGAVKAIGQEACGGCGKASKIFHEIQTTLRLSDAQMDTLKWVLDRYGVELEAKVMPGADAPHMCQMCEERAEEGGMCQKMAKGPGMCAMCEKRAKEAGMCKMCEKRVRGGCGMCEERAEGRCMCQKMTRGRGMHGMCEGEEGEESTEIDADKKIIELLEKITENTSRIYQVIEERQ